MKVNFRDAIEISDRIHNLFWEVLSMEKFKDVSPMLVHFLFRVSKENGCKICTKKLVSMIQKNHPGLKKEKIEVKISKLCSIAIKKGYIEKEIDPNDHRVKYMTITNKGKKLLKQIDQESEIKWKEMYE